MSKINTKNIEGFKNRLKGGGARPNLFEVSIPSFPAGISDKGTLWSKETRNDLRFLCKAAQLPASTVAEIPVPFRGRILKVAGDRTFEPWTITIINDEDFNLRSAFEGWMNTISDLSHGTGLANPSSYMTSAYVSQLGRGKNRNGDKHPADNKEQIILRSYKFSGIFPTEVSAIDLSYDSTDTIEEFTVTFQVQDFRIGKNEQGRDDGNATPTLA
tara:strand:- start:476 stop:1120 length:645 start_codon:yes stop_codon:yes gene_type:complete